jgi:hypothetical protein
VNWKAELFFVLAVITGALCIYDYMQYEKLLVFINTNCDSVIELVLLNEECIALYEQANSLEMELLGLGALTVIFIIAGFSSKDDGGSAKAYNLPNYNLFDEPKADGWPWWIIIVGPLVALFGIAILFIVFAFVSDVLI